jgi:multiple sugar transport system permease protein
MGLASFGEQLTGTSTGDWRGARGRGRSPLRRDHARTALIFLSPWLLGMIGLTLGPMVYSLYLAFTKYNGVQNFHDLVADSRFRTSVVVTIRYVLLSVPVVLIVSMVVALLMNAAIRFITGYRALFYLPSLLGASVAIATLWRMIWGDSGLIPNALSKIGIHHGSFIGDPKTALYTIVSLNAWAFGSTMIIFLAGLRQVSKELLEAAAVDGASRLRRFWHVTLPSISPLIFFSVVMDTLHAFQAFTGAYVTTGGGPADTTLFYTLYLYEKGFAELNMGYAAAMAWLLVLGLAAITGGLFFSSRYWVHYGE